MYVLVKYLYLPTAPTPITIIMGKYKFIKILANTQNLGTYTVID